MPVEVCRLYYHKSTLDIFLRNYDRVIQDQTKSLDIAGKIANKNLATYFKAMSHLLIGETYIEKKNYNLAKHYLSLAFNNKEYILDSHAEAELSCTIGDVHYHQNQNDSAIYYFSKSAQLHKKNKSLINLRLAYLGLGKTYFQMKKYNSAKLYLLKAGNTEILDVDIKILSEVSELLSKIYSMENDYKRAYKYHQIFKEASDELFNNEKIKNITRLELEYDLINKQREFEHIRKQEAITFNAKLKQNRMSRNFAAAGFLLSLLIAIFAYRNYKIKQKANNEKETLLREIHHRVKNNLQIISSMLSLQSNYIIDKNVLNAINESQGRVKSMALIHQMLYQNDKFSSIDIKEYIVQLCNAISSTFTLNGKKVNINYDIDNIMMDIDTAVPLGLIINELVTNSFKYAFKNKNDGMIVVSFKKEQTGNYCLKIADNGIGFNKDKLLGNKKSFGLSMVNILTRQLKGEIKQENKKGTTHIIQFSEVLKTNNSI
jgi:two-component sensor histidine kinase